MAKKVLTDDGEIIDAPEASIYSGPIFFKTPWNHDTAAESARCELICKDPSKTQQQFAKDADINVILRKFTETGELMTTGSPVYQDAEKEFDLQDNIVTAAQVEEAWQALPAKVRNILKDPQTFVNYLSQIGPEDEDDLVDIGLATRKTEPEPPKPATTPQAASPAPSGTPSPEKAPPGA